MNDLNKIILEESMKHFNLLQIVNNYYNKDEIVQVWYCKTIQNAKGLYFNKTQHLFIEATLNGDEKEVYLDEYKKVNKIILK